MSNDCFVARMVARTDVGEVAVLRLRSVDDSKREIAVDCVKLAIGDTLFFNFDSTLFSMVLRVWGNLPPRRKVVIDLTEMPALGERDSKELSEALFRVRERVVVVRRRTTRPCWLRSDVSVFDEEATAIASFSGAEDPESRQ